MIKQPKSYSRSVRMTEFSFQAVESMPGDDGFNQKFEDLIYKCFCELPKKEKQLEEINKDIEKAYKKYREMRDLISEINQLEYVVKKLNRSGESAIDRFDKICNS